MLGTLTSWAACKIGDNKKFYYNKKEYHIIWNIQSIIHVVFPICKLTRPWPVIYMQHSRKDATYSYHKIGGLEYARCRGL
ncbi:hypothetical protein MTR67_018623 [Solanum verrucosum]|uniref:Uncharacterized protein n=1 Tax=Solanum verrucosum TaxID=315347 RepID=A0AAF0TTX3_SOLVR|nr:hypothetical protein MTR67_018623 [Solanum verrucosum]